MSRFPFCSKALIVRSIHRNYALQSALFTSLQRNVSRAFMKVSFRKI
jgi:hypothetical protein